MSLGEVRRLQITTDTSRYKDLDKILYDTGEEVIESRDFIELDQDVRDKIYTVGAGEAGRLDLISYKFYNTPFYWWVLCYANDIADPFTEVYPGRNLRIPNVMAIMNRGAHK